MKHNILAGILAAGMTLSLAACSSSENGTENSSEVSKDTIVIDHAFGQTVIDSAPQTIVTIGWEDVDTPLALGMEVAGTSKASYGKTTDKGLHTWTQEAIDEVGGNPVVFDETDGYDYEAIAALNPDVILASYSGMSQEEYDRLSKIAPVVAYPSQPWQILWREQTEIDSKALGKEEEGKELVEKTETLIEEKLKDYPELDGVKTAFFWIMPNDLSTFYVYTPKDPRAAYLTDLGLEFPDSVKKLQEDEDAFSVLVSRENADQLDDVEMIVVYGDENTLKTLQSDPLLSKIPAVKNGAVAVIDENSDLAGGATPSILSIPYNIDAYLELLSQAAAKAGK